MKQLKFTRALMPGVAAIALLWGSGASFAAEAGKAWLPTWAASPQPIWAADFFAPVGIPRPLRDQTLRQIARISIGGHQLRVGFSNLYGTEPLTISAAHVAIAAEGGATKPGTDKALTFGGKPGITDPARALRRSAIRWTWTVPALACSPYPAYFHDVSPATTWHNDGKQTAYLSAAGDQTARCDVQARTNLSVAASSSMKSKWTRQRTARAVVPFGDSITDGDGSTVDANHRWPDFLAERLQQEGRAGRGRQPGHFGGAHPARSHGRQRARPLRPRRAEPACRRHGGADDGHQRHRLAGLAALAQGRARAIGRRRHRRLQAVDRARARTGLHDRRRDAHAVRGHVRAARRCSATTARRRRPSAQALNNFIRTAGPSMA